MAIVLCWNLVNGQNVWTERAPLPERRAAHAAVVVDTLIYIIGGRGGQQHHASDEFWSYDPALDSWNTTLPSLNQSRSSLVAVALGDTILVFGGRLMSSAQGEVERFIIGSDSWEVIGNMPEPRMGLGAAVVDGKVYLFGGKTSPGMFSVPSDRVDIFDPVSGEWSEGPSLNQARTDFGVSVKNDTIICAGGSYVDPLSHVEIFVDQSAWADVVALDRPRSNASGVILNGRFVLVGGYTSDGISATNLMLEDEQWQEFPGLLLPRYDHTAVEFDGGIYVMGGRSGQQPLDSHERYEATVSVRESSGTVAHPFTVTDPYPNPFNSSFVFGVHLPFHASGRLEVKIVDVRGRLVAERILVEIGDGDLVRMDMSQLGFSSSGIYFLHLEWSDSQKRLFTTTRPIVYLK